MSVVLCLCQLQGRGRDSEQLICEVACGVRLGDGTALDEWWLRRRAEEGEQKRKSCSHKSLTNEAEVGTFAMEMCRDISSADRGRSVPSDQGNIKHHSASRAMARSS